MKKRYICFMKPLTKPDEFQKYIELLDEEQAEIHIFDSLDDDEIKGLIDTITNQLYDKDEDISYCFMTNHMQWLMDMKDTLNWMFNVYIYYNREKPDEVGDGLNKMASELKNALYFSDPQFIRLSKGLIRNDARAYAFNVEYCFRILNDPSRKKIAERYNEVCIRMEELGTILRGEDQVKKECLKECIIKNLIGSSDYAKVFFYSFILQNWRDKDYINKLIDITQNSNVFKIENKWFLYSQLGAWFFAEPDFVNMDNRYHMHLLYAFIYQEYKNKLADELGYMLKENRREERVLVITGQFLSMNHGPTKTALDRCYIIQKIMKKKVVLINVAGFLRPVGGVPFSRMSISNYNKEFMGTKSIKYKDIEINFYQCSENMPNLMEIREIIRFVKNIKPYYIISIGENLTADLCGNLVPVITISTVPSKIAITEGQFVQIGRKLTKEDLVFLNKCGKDAEHVIEGVFTSSFKPQTHHYTRKDLKLPEDKFIVAVVGGRLDSEVSEEFVQMLNQTYSNNVFAAFIGAFDLGYEKFRSKYPEFGENSSYIGFQEDVLACYECCDLYVNPNRTGGGTSVVEAMHKGLPAVTTHYGDVALNAGEDFIVSDYEEMKGEIIRYATDSEYYRMKSDAAQKRAEHLCDSEKAFKDIIQTAMEREAFR